MMNLSSVRYFVMALCMCNTLWGMSKLDKELKACEIEINRMSRERGELLMNASIPNGSMVQLDKTYSNALSAKRTLYEYLKQEKSKLQKELAGNAKL